MHSSKHAVESLFERNFLTDRCTPVIQFFLRPFCPLSLFSNLFPRAIPGEAVSVPEMVALSLFQCHIELGLSNPPLASEEFWDFSNVSPVDDS